MNWDHKTCFDSQQVVPGKFTIYEFPDKPDFGKTKLFYNHKCGDDFTLSRLSWTCRLCVGTYCLADFPKMQCKMPTPGALNSNGAFKERNTN